MATVTTFSVFPQSRVPRISLPNPHNRKPSLRTVETTDLVKESVVIALQEIPVPDIPREYQTSIKSPASDAHTIISTPVFKNGVPPPPPPIKNSKSSLEGSVSKSGQSSTQSSPEPGSISSAETLVRSSSPESSTAPHRSMFPVYNPNVPLSQQRYYPQRPPVAFASQKPSAMAPPSYSYNAVPVSAHGSVMSPAYAASATDVPLETLNFHKPSFSTQKDLETLWDAGQGNIKNMTTSSFDLKMARSEEATFVFSSSVNAPFYTVITYDTSEIGIKKTCPRKKTVVCDVVLSQIESPSRRMPPNDGLVSFLFPKTAAMLAINQSNAFADEFDLAPTDRDEIQSDALKRAAAQEASNLRWNVIDNRYELQHPAVTRRNRDPSFITSPQSPQPHDQPVLHITVVSDPTSQDQPVIIVTCPAGIRSPVMVAGSSAATPKSPEMASDLSLASLDFNTKTLHVEAQNILEVMPSQFAVDSIISALITVAVADQASNTAMGDMKVTPAKPATVRSNSWNTNPASASTPRTGTFYATIAEREEAEEEARVAAKAQRKSAKTWNKSAKSIDVAEDLADVEAGRTWYGRSKAKKQRKTKQIVIGEFDLEKLTHYQSGSRQGQELPAVTRGALTIMVSSLKFVVWFLTMVVQFLAWIMVGLTRGVTSEKF